MGVVQLGVVQLGSVQMGSVQLGSVQMGVDRLVVFNSHLPLEIIVTDVDVEVAPMKDCFGGSECSTDKDCGNYGMCLHKEGDPG